MDATAQLLRPMGCMPTLEKGRDIAERMLALGSEVVCVARRLPKDRWGRHISFQLVRAATGAGSNYEEARGAESRADFVHKVGVSIKELRETIYWLMLIAKAFGANVDAPLDEANQLAAILMASKRTALSNRSPSP
jgi:four helix bundle protein